MSQHLVTFGFGASPSLVTLGFAAAGVPSAGTTTLVIRGFRSGRLLTRGLGVSVAIPTGTTNYPDPFQAIVSSRFDPMSATVTAMFDPMSATVAARVDPFAATVAYKQSSV